MRWVGGGFMRQHKGIGNELERALIEQLVKRHFGEDADALVDYVFEVMNYRSMTFGNIINELQDIRVCSICGEGTHIDYLAETEGQADTSDGDICNFCFENGR
jgi:hypothetical protein